MQSMNMTEIANTVEKSMAMRRDLIVDSSHMRASVSERFTDEGNLLDAIVDQTQAQQDIETQRFLNLYVDDTEEETPEEIVQEEETLEDTRRKCGRRGDTRSSSSRRRSTSRGNTGTV